MSIEIRFTLFLQGRQQFLYRKLWVLCGFLRVQWFGSIKQSFDTVSSFTYTHCDPV